MGVIYIVSVEKGAGKTAICAGLARNLQNAGKTVGYLKPHEAPGEGAHAAADPDMAFMRKILDSADVVNAPDLARGRDVVIVEAMIGRSGHDVVSQNTYGAAREMQANVVAVEAWTGGRSPHLDGYKGFGENLLGLVLNKVPESQLDAARKDTQASLEGSGISLLGVIPENRRLLSVTVGELSERLGGTILNNREKSGELVENFMLGALVVDSGLTYFGRKERKAAIIRQDRPDMQLAALETPTACLVLAGSSQPPLYNVAQKAEQKGIPVITTEKPVKDIVTELDELLLSARIHQEKKVGGLADMINKNLDVAALARDRLN